MSFWVQIQPYVISVAVAVTGVALGWVALKLKSIGLNALTKLEEKVQKHVEPAVEKAIAVVNQTYVDDLKKSGEWAQKRDECMAKAKELCLKTIKSFLPQIILKGISKLFKSENVDKFLESAIEFALKQKPNNTDIKK